ncbi:MAG: cupredoxin family copper-binding protein [Proteobacteria bacterium]|nr:cupredoxin family copper-binding protein [Pseudomonadota bacterium]
MRWRSTIAAATLLPLAIAAQTTASSATSGKPAMTYQVDIRQFHFRPAQLVVPVGAKVTWTNHDEEPHTVTSAGAQFKDSPALDTDDSYSAVFTKPGTYAYFCSVHPFMTATIVVH